MSLAGRIIRVAGRAINPAYKLTPARKAALEKAIKASAAARRKSNIPPGALTKAVRYAERVQGVNSVNFIAAKKVAKMGLKKGPRGFNASAKQFSGAKGTARRLATYKDRLNAGRQSYAEKSFLRKIGTSTIGARYDTLTFGENVRRDIGRNLKINAVANIGFAAGYTAAAVGSELARGTDQSASAVMKQIRDYRNSKEHKPK